MIATVLDPHAKHWDKNQNKFVTGPVESKIFYQVAGIVPDLNHNGIDDIIDIRTNVSTDLNTNGVVDEAEQQGTKKHTDLEFIQWLLLLLLIALFLWLVFLWSRR
jgi:hypothetical protein